MVKTVFRIYYSNDFTAEQLDVLNKVMFIRLSEEYPTGTDGINKVIDEVLANFKAIKGSAADVVQCTFCDWAGFIEVGSEDCPACRSVGSLSWIEGVSQEVATA